MTSGLTNKVTQPGCLSPVFFFFIQSFIPPTSNIPGLHQFLSMIVLTETCVNRERGRDRRFFFTHQGIGCYRGQTPHAGWIQSLQGLRMRPSHLSALEMPVTSVQISAHYRWRPCHHGPHLRTEPLLPRLSKKEMEKPYFINNSIYTTQTRCTSYLFPPSAYPWKPVSSSELVKKIRNIVR